jgi:transcriptional regulator with XRE-family HTH domain
MKYHLKKEIGTRMRHVRKALGFTQNKMVSYFDIGRANYSRIEKGEIFPGPVILNTLKVRFDVSLDWLITGQGEMFLRDHDHKPGKRDNIVNLNDFPQEMKDLMKYMEKVPMVRHAVLGFFIEYTVKNKKFIDPLLSGDGENK